MRTFRTLMAWWIRRHRRGAAVGRSLATQRELAKLDSRTLRDIGLEPWRSPLGARIEAERLRMLRWTAARVGLY